MPFAKRPKYSTKKKSRKTRIPSVYKLNDALVHKHVVTCSTSDFTQLSLTIPASGVGLFNMYGSSSANLQLSFALAGMTVYIGGAAVTVIPLPNVTELKALYDSYVIEKIEVNLWSGNTVSQVGVVRPDADFDLGYVDYTMAPMCLIGHVVDMDDAANTSITQLQQYSQYKCTQLGLGKPINHSFTPCCNDTLSNATGYGRSTKQIINTANDNVQHFGLKLAVDAFKTSNTLARQINTYLSLQARFHLRMIATR